MGLQFIWKGFINPEAVNKKYRIMMIQKNQSQVTWEDNYMFMFLYTLFFYLFVFAEVGGTMEKIQF